MSGPSAPEHESLLAEVPNFRDVGGHETTSGHRIRTGLVFRSGQLDKLSSRGEAAFVATGISTVFDLRTAAEIASAPDVLPPGVRLVPLDVLSDHEQSGPAQLGKLVASASNSDDPVTERERMAQELLGDGKAERLMMESYQSFVTLGSARRAYRAYFTELAHGQRPVLFHCTAGKDRTGWAAASLQLFLGVDQETVVADYLASYEPTMRAFKPLTDYITAQGGDVGLVLPMLEVRTDYLQAALDTVAERYGTIQGYLRQGLDLTSDQLDSLRARMLER